VAANSSRVMISVVDCLIGIAGGKAIAILKLAKISIPIERMKIWDFTRPL